MPGPNSLPHLFPPSIGRTHEIAEIGQVLADPACRLLTLVGPGGSGKTRLSIEVAAGQSGEFPNGVYFVPLAPRNSTEGIVSTIANTLGLALRSEESPTNQLLDYLHDKRLLLVLDNFEHLLAGTVVVTQILEADPEVKLLTTSREALSLEEEWVRQVKGLRFPDSDGTQLPQIEDYSAIRLFAERARRVRADFSLADEQRDVIRICQLVEGVPLAIELAAVWLKTINCQQIADEIQRDMDFLTSPLRNVQERHRSIRAIFEHSWQLLSSEEQATFRKLSVFRGGFTLEAAIHVANSSRQCLTALVDKSLVQMTPTGRFDLHELLRQYAKERLEGADETAATQPAHSHYYPAFIHAREDH